MMNTNEIQKHAEQVAETYLPRLKNADVAEEIEKMGIEDLIILLAEGREAFDNGTLPGINKKAAKKQEPDVMQYQKNLSKIPVAIAKALSQQEKIYAIFDLINNAPYIGQAENGSKTFYLFTDKKYAKAWLERAYENGMEYLDYKKLLTGNIKDTLIFCVYGRGAQSCLVNDGVYKPAPIKGNMIAARPDALNNNGTESITNPSLCQNLAALQILRFKENIPADDELAQAEDKMIQAFQKAKFIVPVPEGQTIKDLEPEDDINLPLFTDIWEANLFDEKEEIEEDWDMDSAGLNDLPQIPAERFTLNPATFDFTMDKNMIQQIITLGGKNVKTQEAEAVPEPVKEKEQVNKEQVQDKKKTEEKPAQVQKKKEPQPEKKPAPAPEPEQNTKDIKKKERVNEKPQEPEKPVSQNTDASVEDDFGDLPDISDADFAVETELKPEPVDEAPALRKTRTLHHKAPAVQEEDVTPEDIEKKTEDTNDADPQDDALEEAEDIVAEGDEIPAFDDIFDDEDADKTSGLEAEEGSDKEEQKEAAEKIEMVIPTFDDDDDGEEEIAMPEDEPDEEDPGNSETDDESDEETDDQVENPAEDDDDEDPEIDNEDESDLELEEVTDSGDDIENIAEEDEDDAEQDDDDIGGDDETADGGEEDQDEGGDYEFKYEDDEEAVDAEVSLVPSERVDEYLKDNVLKDSIIPCEISQPLIRIEDGKAYIAVFAYTYTEAEAESGAIGRPSYVALADMATGKITEEYSTPDEYEFSDAPYDRKYSLETDKDYNLSDEYAQMTFSVLDEIRDEYIKTGTLNTETYKEYLEYVLANIPEEHVKFYRQLSNCLGEYGSADNPMESCDKPKPVMPRMSLSEPAAPMRPKQEEAAAGNFPTDPEGSRMVNKAVAYTINTIRSKGKKTDPGYIRGAINHILRPDGFASKMSEEERLRAINLVMSHFGV